MQEFYVPEIIIAFCLISLNIIARKQASKMKFIKLLKEAMKEY